MNTWQKRAETRWGKWREETNSNIKIQIQVLPTIVYQINSLVKSMFWSFVKSNTFQVLHISGNFSLDSFWIFFSYFCIDFIFNHQNLKIWFTQDTFFNQGIRYNCFSSRSNDAIEYQLCLHMWEFWLLEETNNRICCVCNIVRCDHTLCFFLSDSSRFSHQFGLLFVDFRAIWAVFGRVFCFLGRCPAKSWKKNLQ